MAEHLWCNCYITYFINPNQEKTAVQHKYAYLAAAYNRREKKENWDDREESGFQAYTRSSPLGFQEFSWIVTK